MHPVFNLIFELPPSILKHTLFFPLVSTFAVVIFRRTKTCIVKCFICKYLPTNTVAGTRHIKRYGKNISIYFIYSKVKSELSFLYLRLHNKKIQSSELICFYLTALFIYPRVFWKTESKIPYCSWYRFVFPPGKISVRWKVEIGF